MGRSQRLQENDLRGVLRLMSDLRDMRHDRPGMHRHLVDTLVRLVGATGGYCGDVSGWRPEAVCDDTDLDIQFHSLTIGSDAQDLVARIITELAANNDVWDDPTFAPAIGRCEQVDAFSFTNLMAQTPGWQRDYPLFSQVTTQARHVDHLVGLYHKQTRPDGSPGGDVFGVSLARYGKERPFRNKEKALVRCVFDEMHWLHRTGRLEPPGPGYDQLPPRLREVLTLLLAGLAPKQIASQLGLSVHTVRDHIKRIYERLEVSGREELTAHFVQAGPTFGFGVATGDA